MPEANEFLILGCGHSEALEHFNNNAAITGPEGLLLIDCGATIKHALAARDMNLGDVDAVFVTHVHGDHVFGLERLAYESRFKYQRRVTLFLSPGIYDELWHQTLKGSLGRNSEGAVSIDEYFNVVMVDNNQFSYCGHQLRTFPVRHTPGKPTYGVLVDDFLMYSSDTVAIPDTMAELDFEIGFHDVTLTAENPVHASLDSLIELYPFEFRKKLYLMSYEDHWREYEKRVNEEFRGFARQGMRIDLP